MSTGRRTLRQNTRERLLSSDYNRTETFIGADANEVLRGQMIRPVDDFAYVGTTFTAPGPSSLALDFSVPTAPLTGGVVDGLMVVVPIGATSVLITPGELLVIDPDGQPGSSDPNPANPDDPICKYVRAPGISAALTLNWTPNPGPGIRIDVIECQRADVVQEVDNRDIFNPSTGLFVPTAVTKVTVGDLSYRIRLGVAGGGLPAPALGWFPLAVLSTPAGAPNLDTVGVWDVRNLLSDLAEPYNPRMGLVPTVERGRWLIDTTQPGQARLSGEIVRDFGGYRFGGAMLDMLLGTLYVDLLSPSYQMAGLVVGPGQLLQVYALFPAGYVRWVPYYFAATPGAGGRTPGSYRGILAVSNFPSINGVPSVPIPVPTNTGLSVAASAGVALAHFVTNAASVFRGAVFDGDLVMLSALTAAVGWQTALPAIAGGPNVWTTTYTLVAGIHYPFGARRVRLVVTSNWGLAVAGDANAIYRSVNLRNPGPPALYLEGITAGSVVVMRDTIGAAADLFELDVPTLADGLSQPSGVVTVEVSYVNFGGTVGAAALVSAQAVPVAFDLP